MSMLMRLLAGALASAAMFVAGPATGADVPAAPEPADWTGCYGGLNAGYAHVRNKNTDIDLTPGTLVVDNESDGAAGGLQAGCDLQFGRVVAGARAMFDWTNLDTESPPLVLGGPGAYTATERLGHDTSWLATLTGRIGFLVQPRWLLYANGGAAWARTELTDIDPARDFVGEGEETELGWTVGAGTEVKVTSHWSVFVEYNYIDLGEEDVELHYEDTPPFDYTYRHEQKLQTVLIGANFRF